MKAGWVMRHKDTIELYKYWNEIRADRDAPLRSEIAPAALGRLLPSVMLLERNAGGEIVFRLAGTRLCALSCKELKGRPFSGLFRQEDRTSLIKILNAVERGDSVVVLDAIARRRDGGSVPAEVALLPLVDDRTRILGIATTATTPYWIGAEAAELELRGIRYMDPKADLVFLQSRPSVPVRQRFGDSGRPSVNGLHVLSGMGLSAPKRVLRAFRVLDGGKK
jgi:hypothetical protein